MLKKKKKKKDNIKGEMSSWYAEKEVMYRKIFTIFYFPYTARNQPPLPLSLGAFLTLSVFFFPLNKTIDVV